MNLIISHTPHSLFSFTLVCPGFISKKNTITEILYHFHSWEMDIKYSKDLNSSMNSKTILGISFTSVFLLSIISVATAIQADAIFKVKHLPDFKTTNSVNLEKVKTDMTSENADLTSFGEDKSISEPSILNKQLKN